MSNSNLYSPEGFCIAFEGKDVDDDIIQIVMNLYARDFRAKGSAFFSKVEIVDSLNSFRKFPIIEDNFPVIMGGYFNDEGTEIESEHLFLSVRPLKSTGLLAMTTRVFEPTSEVGGMEFGRGGRCDYLIEYEGIKKLCDDLEGLISGEFSFISFDRFVYR